MIDANEKRLKKLQKELAKEYKAAEKEMLKKAEKYMKAFKEADALELARLKKGEITQAQYDAWRAAKIQRSEWAKRMADELAKGLTDQDVKALSATKAATTSAATEGSMFAQFEAGTLTGKNFTLVSRSAVEQALTGKLYRRKVNIPKDRAWNERHIRSAIAQSLLQGESVADAAKRISQVAEMNRSAALRDARTMINAAEQSGKLAEYEMLAEEGVDIEKGWMATLDERTRDTHAEMDMEFVPVDEKFSNSLMEPCDPDGDPSEVYNCRCTLISRIDGKTISQEERRSKLERPYEEWKNRGNVAVGDNEKWIGAATISEAEDYAKQFVDAGFYNLTGKSVSYDGIDINIANQINKTLTSLYSEYDIPKLSSLEAFGKKNKKIFAENKDAPLFTTNFGNIGINKTIMGDAKALDKYISDGENAFTYVMDHMDTLSGTQREIAEAYKTAGRALVGTNISDLITHEIGHHLSYGKLNKDLWALGKGKEWKDFAKHLSGYATSSYGEYIAESFAAYNKGIKIQPALADLFRRLKK